MTPTDNMPPEIGIPLAIVLAILWVTYRGWQRRDERKAPIMALDTNGLLGVLATPRPSENELMHTITTLNRPNTLYADCTCGRSIETLGRDESAVSAIKIWIRDHMKEGA